MDGILQHRYFMICLEDGWDITTQVFYDLFRGWMRYYNTGILNIMFIYILYNGNIQKTSLWPWTSSYVVLILYEQKV